jgi:hypothetical protein
MPAAATGRSELGGFLSMIPRLNLFRQAVPCWGDPVVVLLVFECALPFFSFLLMLFLCLYFSMALFHIRAHAVLSLKLCAPILPFGLGSGSCSTGFR